MLMTFEKGTRGGIGHIAKRYSEANNKYMKDFTPEKESKFISYLDVNNLCDWAICERLPTHGFKWMKESQLTNEEVIKLLDQRITDHGHLFEVDFEYPKELWDLIMIILLLQRKWRSIMLKNLLETFFLKQHYVLHYQNLKQYLNLSLKFKKS